MYTEFIIYLKICLIIIWVCNYSMQKSGVFSCVSSSWYTIVGTT